MSRLNRMDSSSDSKTSCSSYIRPNECCYQQANMSHMTNSSSGGGPVSPANSSGVSSNNGNSNVSGTQMNSSLVNNSNVGSNGNGGSSQSTANSLRRVAGVFSQRERLEAFEAAEMDMLKPLLMFNIENIQTYRADCKYKRAACK